MEVEKILVNLPTTEVANASWQNYAAVIIVENLTQSIPLLNQLAPEHVELCHFCEKLRFEQKTRL